MSKSISPYWTGIYFWYGRLPCWTVYFSKPVYFWPCGRGAKAGNKWNNRLSVTIFWAVPHPVSLVWMVVESNNFCYFRLGHSTASAQFRLHMWGHSKSFYTSATSSWVFTIPCTLVPDQFVGFYIPLFFFALFILLGGWMFYVHSIKFPFRIVLGSPSPILAVSGNIFLWFLDTPGFKIVKSLNMSLAGLHSFSVGADISSVISSSLECCNNRIFFSLA